MDTTAILATTEAHGYTVNVRETNGLLNGARLFVYDVCWTNGVGDPQLETKGSWASVEDALKSGIGFARIKAEVHAEFFGPQPRDIFREIKTAASSTTGNCHYCGLPVGPHGCEECV